MKRVFIYSLIIFVGLVNHGWAGQKFSTNDEHNTIEVFKKASPSVVYVTTTALKQDFFSFNVYEIPQGAGSGFIWDDKGHIVTNFHVIQGAKRITVTLHDHANWEASIIGLAPEKDLAVLKLENAVDSELVMLPLGDSNELEVGRKVLAIGNPFGLDTTLTVGVVSALGREIKSVNNRTIRDVIQTDAAINPGNSGGPLLNSSGELIGVNTAIYSPSGASAGIGFAIPSVTVKKTVSQLIQYGRLIRPIIGVETAPDSWAKSYGLKGIPIVKVIPGLPAATAGLEGMRRDFRGRLILGDIIIGIDGQSVLNSDDLFSALEKFKPGDNVPITLLREEEVTTIDITVIAPDTYR